MVKMEAASDYDLIVKHILIECGEFAENSQRFYDVENITSLFQDISVTEVLDFRSGLH